MLHGKIKVNHQVIVDWSAVNETADMRMDAVNTYRCLVRGRDLSGYPFKSKFRLEHRYGDGAEVLVAKIMNEFPAHKKRWTPAFD